MATDSVAKELERLNQTLREISSSLKEQTRILKTMAQNYVEVNQKSNEKLLPPLEQDEQAENKPKLYGWSMAALAQREGSLNVGDVKIEDDESRWVWTTGETWERVEPPSGQT